MITSLGVQDNQLRPNASYVDRVLSTTYDIRLCEGIFNGWVTHLDKCVQRRVLSFEFSPSERLKRWAYFL